MKLQKLKKTIFNQAKTDQDKEQLYEEPRPSKKRR